MYREDVWKQVHALDRRGLSKSAIARKLKMSRNTVRRLLALEKPPTFDLCHTSIDESLEILANIVIARAEEFLARERRDP